MRSARLPRWRSALSDVPGLRSAGVGVRGLGGQPFCALEQGAHLGLPEPAVSARGADAADAAGGGPAGHCLRVDPEQRGHLARGEETIPSVHSPSLTSTKATPLGALPTLRAA